jgi:beta-glucosidase
MRCLWAQKYKKRLGVFLFVLFVLIGSLSMYLLGFFESVPSLSNARFHDSSRTTEERIDDLIAHMTLAEKIGQMALVEKNSIVAGDIARYGIGGVLSGAGAKPGTNTSEGWATMVSGFQSEAETSRLGIPLLYGVDAVHGDALVPGVTVFPHQIGLGATGDATLVEQIGAATAADIRMTGVNWNFAPNLDLPQDIRWGRTYEAFSDDPSLASRLGAAYVRGLQSTTTRGQAPVLATLKHYAGLGAMQWRTSQNKNFHIDQATTPVDMTAFEQSYLPPFASGVDAGALSVMVGLNTWDGKRLVTNRALIDGELKTKLGFRGFVVSDWYGVYEGRTNLFGATVEAVNAGVDLVMLPFDYKTFERNLTIANRLGLVSTARIDDAVRRILRAKFALGLFDAPILSSATTTPFANHDALARAAVAKSLVLLKNENHTLPITPAVQHIRVAGSAADNVGQQSGAWTVEWQGVDGNWLPHGTSIFAGIKARVPKNTFLEYNASGTFSTNSEADLGIAVVGETPYAEGWGDRAYPILSNDDLAAIKNLQVTCKKVVVIIVSGRPLLIANEVGSWDALVAAWLPGTAGEGVADVLFGDKKFSGKLPLPWPKTSEQLPLTLTGKTADGTDVLFPRYFGLTQ